MTDSSSRAVVIVAAARTPVGSFGGCLSQIPATKLGSIAISGALKRAGLEPAVVDACYMGNVLSAGLGQAPARQAALGAGLPYSCGCTTVNKVCASGLKAVSLAANDIVLGNADVVVAGGMENMSQVPHYLRNARFGQMRLGDGALIDGAVFDGLFDPYNEHHMGLCGEICARKHGISREEQDDQARESYTRSLDAWEKHLFDEEIEPVPVPTRKRKPSKPQSNTMKNGSTANNSSNNNNQNNNNSTIMSNGVDNSGDNDMTFITKDEECYRYTVDQIPTMRPAFIKDGSGTVTSGNASGLNDGAAALVLMSAARADQLGCRPLARILSFADAATEPVEFTTAPSLAIPKAIGRANIDLADVDVFEINEAFSVVVEANLKLLGIPRNIVNVWGGAVSLGHPIGCSGARVLVTLLSVMKSKNSGRGVAAICNGGGGATAMVIERNQMQKSLL